MGKIVYKLDEQKKINLACLNVYIAYTEWEKHTHKLTYRLLA